MWDRYKHVIVLLIAIAVAVACWHGWEVWVVKMYPDMPSRGLYGDMFGGINALFSALILAGGLYTIWLQHRQIEDMKEQQVAASREAARTTLVLSYTAMVNAKNSMLSTHLRTMDTAMELLPKLQVGSDQASVLFLMLQANAEGASRIMKDVESLTEDLHKIVDDLKLTVHNP